MLVGKEDITDIVIWAVRQVTLSVSHAKINQAQNNWVYIAIHVQQNSTSIPLKVYFFVLFFKRVMTIKKELQQR